MLWDWLFHEVIKFLHKPARLVVGPGAMLKGISSFYAQRLYWKYQVVTLGAVLKSSFAQFAIGFCECNSRFPTCRLALYSSGCLQLNRNPLLESILHLMTFNHVLLPLKMIIVSCVTDFSLLSLTLMNLFTIIAHKRNPYERTDSTPQNEVII